MSWSAVVLVILSVGFFNPISAQLDQVNGHVSSKGESIAFAKVTIPSLSISTQADVDGKFYLFQLKDGKYEVHVSAFGFETLKKEIEIRSNGTSMFYFEMIPSANANLSEVVVSGAMRPVSRLDSPINIEVYNAQFFKTNPNPTLFESLQNINGVRPQVNCNICSTGDIHINGLEGPYTMILIDGMPIVSGLSSVYGLNGIPQSLIDRIEIVKGPASTLYGSEAVGGLINVITKSPSKAPIVSLDVFGTTYGEVNADVAAKFKMGKKAQSLLGINYFNYSSPVDKNNDGFTDVTLQDRISVFNKWTINRKNDRLLTFAARYIYEDRWGGEMNWNKRFRGGDSIYGESIYTNRWELYGIYQLPVKENIFLQLSASGHYQNSAYGEMIYQGKQTIGFGQIYWQKKIKRFDFLAGTTYRYTFYDDNTPATQTNDAVNGSNMPQHMYLPGVFLQSEFHINEHNTLLLGARYDYNFLHGNILSPRLNYKWNSHNKRNILRVGVGNGYRVANVFTEDHAALTGARKLVFESDLKPETSWNANVNFVKIVSLKKSSTLELDGSVFYTYFTNKIIPDYETNSNEIRYDNLNGFATSKGISLNVDYKIFYGLGLRLGGTLMDVSSVENGLKSKQLFTENFTGTWTISYEIKKWNLQFDYTGNVYSPMKLPLLSDLDPREGYSPWWSIQNIQITKKFNGNFEVYGGIKNLLNWLPSKGNPFLIARPHDPFDKQVQFDANGQAQANASNPYGLTFDPTYVYAPNQGIRGFLGVRWIIQ